jgi:hypothetical protein
METTGFYLLVGGRASNAVTKTELLQTEAISFWVFQLVHRTVLRPLSIENSENQVLEQTEFAWISTVGRKSRAYCLLRRATKRYSETPSRTLVACKAERRDAAHLQERPATIRFHIRWLSGLGVNATDALNVSNAHGNSYEPD